MIADSESTDGLDRKPEHLSKKELGKRMRREAYLRIKKFWKTDPRQIAMMEKVKQQLEQYEKEREA